MPINASRYVDEQDATVSASYLLARPKALRLLAELSQLKILERAKGFEPSTPTLAGRGPVSTRCQRTLDCTEAVSIKDLYSAGSVAACVHQMATKMEGRT